LSGLPEAITTVFPQTVVQTCVVHVIRTAMTFVSYADRKKVAAGMRAIYTAPSLEAAEVDFTNFEADVGKQYPGSVDVGRRACKRVHPVPGLSGGVAADRVHYECDLGPSTSHSAKSPRTEATSHPTTRR
jgi:Transposase, Mutator family